MAESQRKAASVTVSLDDEVQQKRDRWFLATFFLGLAALVAGMFWIADGLSDNWRVQSSTFYALVVLAVLTGITWMAGRLATRQ